MAFKAKVDLVRLIEQAAGQVYGSDERRLLEQWLARNNQNQVVEIDLDEIAVEPVEDANVPALEAVLPELSEELDLALLEERVTERIADWLCEAGTSDAVLIQVQPTSNICDLAAQAAASVIMAFERGYRLGGGDGDHNS